MSIEEESEGLYSEEQVVVLVNSDSNVFTCNTCGMKSFYSHECELLTCGYCYTCYHVESLSQVLSDDAAAITGGTAVIGANAVRSSFGMTGIAGNLLLSGGFVRHYKCAGLAQVFIKFSHQSLISSRSKKKIEDRLLELLGGNTKIEWLTIGTRGVMA